MDIESRISDFTNEIQDIAEKVLQTYIKSLQNPSNLNNILSDYCTLDYFGKRIYGKEAVSSHLMKYLQGSNYELSSFKVNNQPSNWEPISHGNDSDQDLGVSFLSPPKVIFPSLAVTPNRSESPKNEDKREKSLKRCAKEAALEGIARNLKMCKVDSSQKISKEQMMSEGIDIEMSSPIIQKLRPDDLKYLSAQGTIRYPKKAIATTDPKRIKHHSIISPRDRFCQLDMGFQCDKDVKDLTSNKIWRIRYCVSSRVTPRNLLTLFNEVEPD